ncbi:MAG: hypothetical protein ACP5ID_00025 [Conexivisphaera sp.]
MSVDPRSGIVLQLEPVEGRSSYVELGPAELEGLAASVACSLRAAGVRAGDKLLVYDFSTSLASLALTRAYVPGLRAGACDEIGCSVMSLDGLPSLAARAAFFYSLMRPEALIVRRELLAPLRARLRQEGLRSNPKLRSLIEVSRDPLAPLTAEIPGARTLYVVDSALFLALIDGSGRVDYPADLYETACDGGSLSVRPSFARGLGFARTQLRCAGEEVIAS